MIVLGLGNPGGNYARTRHNLGAMAIAEVATRNGASLVPNTRSKSLLAEVKIGSEIVALAFPQTYMNNSGQCLPGLSKKYPITSADQLIVIHDELDLPPGVVRVKRGGGVAGHNGLKSVVAYFGSSDFLRIRIGIGRPMSSKATVGYVLAPPSLREHELMESAIKLAADVLEDVVTNGVDSAMNRYNAR